jgi:hypothetical protein
MQQPQQAPQPQQPSQTQSQALGLQAMQPQQPLVRPGVWNQDVGFSFRFSRYTLHSYDILRGKLSEYT